MTNKKQLNNKLNNQLGKKWDITPFFSRTKTGYGKKSHAKNKKTDHRSNPLHRSHSQVQIPPPTAENILKWFVVSLPPPVFQTTEKWERTKFKVKGHVSKIIKMVKRKRAVKNLPAHDKKEEKDVWAIFLSDEGEGRRKDQTNTNLPFIFFVCSKGRSL